MMQKSFIYILLLISSLLLSQESSADTVAICDSCSDFRQVAKRSPDGVVHIYDIDSEVYKKFVILTESEPGFSWKKVYELAVSEEELSEFKSAVTTLKENGFQSNGYGGFVQVSSYADFGISASMTGYSFALLGSHQTQVSNALSSDAMQNVMTTIMDAISKIAKDALNVKAILRIVLKDQSSLDFKLNLDQGNWTLVEVRGSNQAPIIVNGTTYGNVHHESVNNFLNAASSHGVPISGWSSGSTSGYVCSWNGQAITCKKITNTE